MFVAGIVNFGELLKESAYDCVYGVGRSFKLEKQMIRRDKKPDSPRALLLPIVSNFHCFGVVLVALVLFGLGVGLLSGCKSTVRVRTTGTNMVVVMPDHWVPSTNITLTQVTVTNPIVVLVTNRPSWLVVTNMPSLPSSNFFELHAVLLTTNSCIGGKAKEDSSVEVARIQRWDHVIVACIQFLDHFVAGLVPIFGTIAIYYFKKRFPAKGDDSQNSLAGIVFAILVVIFLGALICKIFFHESTNLISPNAHDPVLSARIDDQQKLLVGLISNHSQTNYFSPAMGTNENFALAQLDNALTNLATQIANKKDSQPPAPHTCLWIAIIIGLTLALFYLICAIRRQSKLNDQLAKDLKDCRRT